MGVTTVDGEADLADRFVASAGIELATNPWAGAFDLVLVGFPELAGVNGRPQSCGSLQEAIGILAARADQLGNTAGPPVRDSRLTDPANPQWTLTLLVSRIRPEPQQMTRLLEAAAAGSGIAVLMAGDVTDPDDREAPANIDLRDDPAQPGAIKASLHPLGIVLTACAFGAGQHSAISEIIAAAGAPDVAPGDPPYRTAGIATWLAAPTADDDPPGGTAGDGGAHRAAAAPAAGPDGPADAGRATDGPQLRVAILGPFQISGAAADLQPKHSELVLALALAGSTGLSNVMLRTVLGPDGDNAITSDYLRQIITRTRRELGTTAAGDEYIVHVGNSQYVLDEGAWLDWHAFRALAETGRQDRDRERLWNALELIRGRPLDGIWHWWVETALVEAIRAEIVDTADLLAELELAAHDPATAGRAARIGLAADGTAEQLWRAVMRAEDAAGNSAGVHKAWRDCLQAIADIAPGGEPHQNTTALYSQLTRRRPAHASQA
jgi:DNA-binding SARP family transcriptional activator